MAIQRLEPENPVSFAAVPLFKDWIEDKPFPEGETFKIRRFKYTSKGMALFTDAFCCYLFANEKLCTQLLEAIGHYLQQLDAYGLFVLLDSKSKRKFTVVLDDEAITTYKELEQHHWMQEFADEYPKSTTSLSPHVESNPLIKESRKSPRTKR